MEHVNKSKPWTKSDREFIRKNFLKMNNHDLAFHIGRTYGSVGKEMNKMKLKRPIKSSLPKIYKKKGRKTKVYSVAESIKRGLENKRKEERKEERKQRLELERSKRIANEALWAADFVDDEKPIKTRTLINPIHVSVPDVKALFEIDSGLPAKKIESKIAAIKNRYGDDDVIVSNFSL